MGDKNWFRNETWDDAVAAHFNEKLRRAKNKAQYLKIQAGILAKSRPEIAHALLDRYFEFPVNLFRAQAFTARASAYLTQGKISEAISSYEDALAREVEFPHLFTGAYLKLPLLIAVNSITDKYARAIEILNMNAHRPTFPLEHFEWNASHALIAKAMHQAELARNYARAAFAAANRQHSGFRYHPVIGLVSDDSASLLERIKLLID